MIIFFTFELLLVYIYNIARLYNETCVSCNDRGRTLAYRGCRTWRGEEDEPREKLMLLH
jgi:hypothetical protein